MERRIYIHLDIDIDGIYIKLTVTILILFGAHWVTMLKHFFYVQPFWLPSLFMKHKNCRE